MHEEFYKFENEYQEKYEKEKPIIFNPLNLDNYVVKSYFWMYFMRYMNINQMKLLDVYLSCLNQDIPEQSKVIIFKKDFEKFIGVKRIRNEKFSELVQNLDDICVIGINGEKCHIFSTLRVDLDENNERYITMDVNEKVKGIVFIS